MVECYSLSNELYGHEKCIRCVCILRDGRIVTGGLDNKIYIWNITNGNSYKWEKCLTHHTRYVFVVEPSNLTFDKHNENIFYSGGLDQIIYRVSADNGKVILTFEGHESAVCSIKEVPELNLLISGSWDGSARIWDLDSSICRYVFSGHSHAVTIGIIPYIENGSAYILSGSQNKTLYLWRIPSGDMAFSISNSHNDIIRSISVSMSNFNRKYIIATVSNDCVIKIWELSIEPGNEKIVHKASKAYHTSFIFDVLFSSNYDRRLFTASDDCKVGIWYISLNFELTLVQTISLSSTIWSLAESPMTNSLITASEDGICRIWKADSSKENIRDFSSEPKITVIRELEKEKSHVDRQYNFDINEEAFDIKELDRVVGSEFGQIRLFKDDSTIFAYRWSENGWSLVGKIKDKTEKNKLWYDGDYYFSGGLYDYILNVIMNDNNQLGKLPLNIGDNIEVLAENFCLREGLPTIKYSKTVCGLIKNILESKNKNDSNIFISIDNDKFEPIIEYKSFKSYNIDGLMTSIMSEISLSTSSCNNKSVQANSEHMLLEIEMQHLSDFFNRIKNKSNFLQLNELQIKTVEMDIIYKKLSNWLGIRKIAIPIIDLWRILAIHPQSSDIHKKSDQGWWLISSILRLVDSLYSKSNNAFENEKTDELMAQILLISLRFLSNMFYNPTNRQVMISRRKDILCSIDISIRRILKNISFSKKESLNDSVRLAIITLFLNYTISLNLTSINSLNMRNILIMNSIEVIKTFINTEYSNGKNDILYNSLLVISNNYYHYINSSINETKLYIVEDSLLDFISNFIRDNKNCNSINKTEKAFNNILNLINKTKE